MSASLCGLSVFVYLGLHVQQNHFSVKTTVCSWLVVVVPRTHSKLHLNYQRAATVQQQVADTGPSAEIHQGPLSVQPLRERLPNSACKAQTCFFFPAVG